MASLLASNCMSWRAEMAELRYLDHRRTTTTTGDGKRNHCGGAVDCIFVPPSSSSLSIFPLFGDLELESYRLADIQIACQLVQPGRLN